jgi:hypothetical protein
MVLNLIQEMITKTIELQEHILEDMEDIKSARHEKLLDRNEIKLEKMHVLASKKEDLNHALLEALQQGKDVNQYRNSVDTLEEELKKLYMLNARLGSLMFYYPYFYVFEMLRYLIHKF